MCNNLRQLDAMEVTGYKVVLEKNGRYYSPAMGIRYHDGELVKIPKKQSRLAKYFNKYILTDFSHGFRSDMVGRTSAFASFGSADTFVRIGIRPNEIREGFNLVIRKVALSDSLMVGDYGEGFMGIARRVYAGRRVRFL